MNPDNATPRDAQTGWNEAQARQLVKPGARPPAVVLRDALRTTLSEVDRLRETVEFYRRALVEKEPSELQARIDEQAQQLEAAAREREAKDEVVEAAREYFAAMNAPSGPAVEALERTARRTEAHITLQDALARLDAVSERKEENG